MEVLFVSVAGLVVPQDGQALHDDLGDGLAVLEGPTRLQDVALDRKDKYIRRSCVDITRASSSLLSYSGATNKS